MNLTAIILSHNESIHLERCLQSIKDVVDTIMVVDCFSTDNTLDIARNFNAIIVQRVWTNHADQFNWALTQLESDTEWILRIDADEFLTPELAEEIECQLPAVGDEVNGVYLNRRMTFQRNLICHGGVFPVRILRLFRYGQGQCENRLMDEHIKVSGLTTAFCAEIIDDNLNSLSWWTAKHNKYSSLEAIDLLNHEFRFMQIDSIATLKGGEQASVKRWLKEKVYSRMPGGFRAFAYFFYRYFIRMGFLDGQQGRTFHVLQGFWYRYLVDAKVVEVKRYMTVNQVDAKNAIHSVLGVRL